MLLSPEPYSSCPLQATPTSPIRVKVEPSHDASKVKAEGPGLSRTGEDGQHPVEQPGGPKEAWGKAPLHGPRVSSGVELGKPTHFTINAKAAGKGKLDVQFSGLAKGDAVRDVDIIDHHDNTYTVKYTPVQQVVTLTSQQLHSPATPAKHVGFLEWRARWAAPEGFPTTLDSHLGKSQHRRLGAGEQSQCFSHPPSMPKWERHRPGKSKS